MISLINRLLQRESIRYLIAGGCTTLVNLGGFYILRNLCGIELNISNLIAILVAIIFAFVVNKLFVFESKSTSPEAIVKEALAFFSARIATMFIEIGGVVLFVESMQMNEMLAKLLTQFVVLALNYVFSKLFIFRKKSSAESRTGRSGRDHSINVSKQPDSENMTRMGRFCHKNQLYLLAFLIPFLILIVICIIYEIQPFGDNSLVIIDGLHQYMPFFSEYRQKLLSGDSLLYTWNSGLGLNFLALWAYYLSSPLNLLIVLVKQQYLCGMVSFLIVLKISLCGMTMAIFLNNTSLIRREGLAPNITGGWFAKRRVRTEESDQGLAEVDSSNAARAISLKAECSHDKANRKRRSRKYAQTNHDTEHSRRGTSTLILLFSTAYALSNYVIGYSWNVMWLESIALLPIILLGVERLIRKNDGRLYCLALFGSLFCNFYMSFMTCLFLIVYFLLFEFDSVKQFIKKGFIFAGYSLLAAGMAAVVLIPTYNGLMMTSSAKLQFPKPEWYRSFIDIISSHSAFTPPLTNLQDDGGVNLFCGVLVILLINLYLLDRRIRLRVRLKQVAMVLFLLVSFNLTTLNYIWHGFHDQYGIPNRFAYIYILLLIVMSYQVLCHIRTFSKVMLFWSYGICAGFLILSITLSKEPQEWYTYVLTGIFLTIYLLLLLWFARGRIRRRQLRYLLTGVMIVELIATTIFGYANTGQVSISKFYSSTEGMQAMKKELDKDTSFYRTELGKATVLDEVTWNHLKGVSLFGSTANGDLVYTMGRFGFYSAANEYLYRGSTPFTNAVLGLKYLIMRPGDDTMSEFAYQQSVGDIDIYQNDFALPIAFMVDPAVKDLEYKLNNPFVVQNNLAEATIPSTGDIFRIIEVPEAASTNECTLTPSGGGYYSFTNTASKEDNVVFTIDSPNNADMYLYITGNQIESILIKNNGNIVHNEKLNSQIVPVGLVNKDGPVTVSLKLKNDGTNAGNISIMAATFRTSAFVTYTDTLKKQAIEVSDHTSTSIKGSIDVQKDGVLFTSIPYDPGWKVIVDGRELPTEEISKTADAFLSINLTTGTHQLEFHYSPAGYRLGFLLSGGAVLIFAAINLLKHTKHKKKQTSGSGRR